MEGYLGEFPVDLADTEYANYGPADWAMHFIASYGYIDGNHHKQWLIDTVARLLKGTPVTITEARWDKPHSEYRFHLGEPSADYLEWVEQMGSDDDDGERYNDDGEQYPEWDTGTPP